MSRSSWGFQIQILICICSFTFIFYFFLFGHVQHHSVIRTVPTAIVLSPNRYKFKSTGLYQESSVILELNETMHNQLLKEDIPVLIAYYASWCGHCRHFVPKYENVASVTLFEREERQISKRIVFAAVNCADLHDLCSTHKIEFFPTLRPYHFNVNDSDSKEIVGGSEKKLTKFIFDFYLNSNVVYSKNSLFEDKAKSVTILQSEAEKWFDAKRQNVFPYLTTKAKDRAKIRFLDGIASLHYLLQVELNYPWEDFKVQSMKTFLSILVKLIPKKEKKLIDLYQKMIKVLEEKHSYSLRSTSKTTVLSNILRDYMKETPIGWKFCGTSDESISEYEKGNHGFTCGLWLLFHYLSVNGEVYHGSNISKVKEGSISAADFQNYNITAPIIMESIFSFIDNFFRCQTCREHFSQHYKNCEFGRCEIKTESDFFKLQMWLFNLHNMVNVRVFNKEIRRNVDQLLPFSLQNSHNPIIINLIKDNKYEIKYEANTNFSLNNFIKPDKIAKILWPSAVDCNECYKNENANELHILEKEKTTLSLNQFSVLFDDKIFELPKVQNFLRSEYFYFDND